MIHSEIREKFLKFFEERGHKIVPSSSLLPNDPSVLFTTAGMQQFKPYYTGEADPMKDFGSLNTASIQKSMRTSDIDEVGDETHLTFFEMLGNFSFGGYWKEDAIKYAHEFITKELGLKISYVTVFIGSDVVPKDEESKKIWQNLGVDNIREEGMEDVFWGPTGSNGPCGPTTEVYCKNANDQDVEIWNIVFNEFFCDGSREQLLAGKANLLPLSKKGIDTGMGLERLAMISQNVSTIFDTDLFSPLLFFLSKELSDKIRRIISDHARSIVFLLSDGVQPSNKEAGYVLRRLMRRIFVYQHIYKLRADTLEELMKIIFNKYGKIYPELLKNRDNTINAMWMEYEKFNKTVGNGIKELEKLQRIDAVSAFTLYESYGLPYEIIKEIGTTKAEALTREEFEEEFKKHQEKSRAGAEKKFGGHGLILDTGELKAGNEEELAKVTRLHTATHLLQAALRKVFSERVHQAGSDINADRLRFDFTFPRKLTGEEIKQVQNMVNDFIAQNLPVERVTMDYEEAIKTDALHSSRMNYPPVVDVYEIGQQDNLVSREFCGGPHIKNTGEIGHFKITKEEAVSSGVRRIRATVE